MKSRDEKSLHTMHLCFRQSPRPFSPAYLSMTDLGNDPNLITVICLRKPTPTLFRMFTVTPLSVQTHFQHSDKSSRHPPVPAIPQQLHFVVVNSNFYRAESETGIWLRVRIRVLLSFPVSSSPPPLLTESGHSDPSLGRTTTR